MKSFELTSEPLAGLTTGVVIRIRGELDMRVTSKLKEEFNAIIGTQTTHALIYLDDVTFIDSHNLGVFVGAYQKVRSRSGWIGIICTQPYLRRVFDITNLDKLFRFFESPQAFLDALAQDRLLPPDASARDAVTL